MSPLTSLVLQQLDRLNGSSPYYHDQLHDVLHGEEYVQCVPNLQGEELVWLVDYLDKVLDGLDPSGSVSRKSLRELRSICGTTGVLPTSYTLPPHLLNISPEPFASGGFGDVYMGTLNGARICAKRLRVYNGDPQKLADAFCQEAVVWKRLTHPNIVPLLGVTRAPSQLISEWMSGGELRDYIKNNPEANRLGLLSDIAKGLSYLHSCNVVHGCLKGVLGCSNFSCTTILTSGQPDILVDAAGHARITDFGLATIIRNLDSAESVSDPRGYTPRWAAPEVLNGGACGKEGDIFSFAMVMVEIFTGAIPFGDHTSIKAVWAITQGTRPPRPTHPIFTEKLWTLMQRCWDQDPHMRPDASEVLQTFTPDPRSDPPAWERLISHTLSTHERISLIVSIFSDRNQVKVVEGISGDDAQNFIDVIDAALGSLDLHIRKKCLRSLYRICGRQALLPRSLAIPLCYNPMKIPQYHGGFGDVWEGQYGDLKVAAKVLRVYTTSDFARIRRRFCKEVVGLSTLRHPNVLQLLGVTMTETRFVMVSEWMVNGNINQFVKADTNADRLGLLAGVVRGLMYMHGQEIIHGDLKGANILINNDGHACISDFSLLTVTSDPQTFLSSCIEGGTTPWMSPELLDPESFGLEKSRPTRESDRYALGMVFYEVLNGRAPFAPFPAPVLKILRGERPVRPEGAQGTWFTDDIWGVLELCWKAQPGDRPSLNTMLQCLQGVTRPYMNEDVEVDADVQSVITTASDSSSMVTCPTIPDSSLPTGTHDDNELPVPPHGSPNVAGPMIQQDDSQLPDQSQTGNPKQGWIGGRFVRSTREKFKAIARKPFGR